MESQNNYDNNNWIAAGSRLVFPLNNPKDEGGNESISPVIQPLTDPTIGGIIYPYSIDNEGNIKP